MQWAEQLVFPFYADAFFEIQMTKPECFISNKNPVWNLNDERFPSANQHNLHQITFRERFWWLGTFLFGTIPQILWPLSDIVSWCVTKYISGHRLQLPFGTIVLCSSHRFGGQTISYILCTHYTSLFYFILCVYYPTWQPAQRETCVCARAVRLQRHPLPSVQFFALLCNILSHEIVIYLFLTNYPIKIHFNILTE